MRFRLLMMIGVTLLDLAFMSQSGSVRVVPVTDVIAMICHETAR